MKLKSHIEEEVKRFEDGFINVPPNNPCSAQTGTEMTAFLRVALKSIAYKSKENAFDVLMSCMPKSAENINTITPEDARKMLQDFVKKYWYKDE